jgi:hypothetical protein
MKVSLPEAGIGMTATGADRSPVIASKLLAPTLPFESGEVNIICDGLKNRRTRKKSNDI